MIFLNSNDNVITVITVIIVTAEDGSGANEFYDNNNIEGG